MIDQDTRKRDRTLSFYDSDEDDVVLEGDSGGIPDLESYLQRKEAEEIPLKKSRFNFTQDRLDPPRGISNRAQSAFKPIQNAALNDLSSALNANDIEISELTYDDSPPALSALADDMDIDGDELFLPPSNAQESTVRSSDSHRKFQEDAVYASTSSTRPEKQPKYSRPPPSGSFAKMVCPRTGKTLYVPKLASTRNRAKPDEIVRNITKSSGLLSKPIWKMLNDIKENDEAVKMAIQKEEFDKTHAKKSKIKKTKHCIREENQLWVDKYRPKSFMDLLGDQRVNRDVLKWVKQWDYCVFGKLPPQESQREKAFRQYKSTFGSKPNYGKNENRLNKAKDPLLRPEQKILLISGPPGFGKTTLAHVVAKHAGYNTIEINASDDRTGSAVQSKIKSALEMQAIFTEKDLSGNSDKPRLMSMEQRPNMLIIDEIDGVSSAGGSDSFIQKLVQLASADIDDNTADKRKVMYLRYVRLEQLRIVLQEICENEGLRSDLKTLSALSETMNGDIRSCLNTLQLKFIQGKGSIVTESTLNQAGLNQKDAAKSLFTIWEEIFNAPNARKKSSALKDTGNYIWKQRQDFDSGYQITKGILDG
ncbi:hypothetical protein EC973_008969 [Apophysomyces ossiformis]|uniref:AAA+ ATPase domain-containing protein n=1 Tax=Apophysomyces ossiformis TaxID=679940 RepID=A0A8H7BMX4_9FUNG|nr:hypothetical protein EC973_008969 [Apophysomyces ossiformis]